MIVFDNRCYLCIKFAQAVNYISRGKLTMVGHYTPLGEELKEQILTKSARDMFWLINQDNAYGGRAALLPLLRSIISAKNGSSKINIDDTCTQQCKTIKSVFIRSASLITSSKKIPLK